MNEDLDGPRPDGVEGTQQVAGGLGIEAVDYLSFAEHDEGLWDGESHGGSKKKVSHQPVSETGQQDRPSVIGRRDPAPPMGC